MKGRQDESPFTHEDALLLLPWYVNGTLNEADARRVQRHVANCESCCNEAGSQRSLKDALHAGVAVEYTPQASLAKLMERVDASDSSNSLWRTLTARLKSKWSKALLPFGENRFGSLLITASVQAVVIVLLLSVAGWLMLGPAMTPRYQTLTATREAPSASGDMVRIVFDESLQLSDVHSLLHEIGGHIAAGPTTAGVYTIRIDEQSQHSSKHVAGIAAWLRGRPGVRFAEPITRQE